MSEVKITPQAAGMLFDRDIYFATIKASLFKQFSQRQVDGQEAILGEWERIDRTSDDLRHLAYMLATTYHETSTEMWPIEEYGKGQGMSYGVPDPETGQTYYGRGYVQLTWRDNYARADRELGLTGEDSCEWHAQNALDPNIAACIMFEGMWEGWFRTHKDGEPEDLDRYFNPTTNDPYGAREIINGDKSKVPSWSGGVSIGNLIKGYHEKFLEALQASEIEEEIETEDKIVAITIETPPGVVVRVHVKEV